MPTGPASPETDANDSGPEVAGSDAGTGHDASPAGSSPTRHAGSHAASPVRPDRWAWRARVRRNPTTRRVYRLAVGAFGVLLLLLAAVTGPLPGPGGIPLALLGLAVLASEFAWAARLLDLVRRELVRAGEWARRQPGWVQRLGAVVTVAMVAGAGYLYLLALGVPRWLPADVQTPLQSVPGLE